MAFIEAGWALVEEGATLITTSCGFLVTAQKPLAEALPVPVVTSSLLQIPQVQASLPPGRRVGVLAYDARRLSIAQLAIGRASCRERGCQYVSLSGVAGSLKKKQQT